MNGLAALRAANFDWVMRLDDVWRDLTYHVPELNAALREDILYRCRQVGSDPKGISPLGWVVLGPAGAGKTHMLASLRRDCSSFANFVLVDLTDVNDFWESVLLGFLNSLREPENQPQCRIVLEEMIRKLGISQAKAAKNISAMSRVGQAALTRNSNKLIQALGQKFMRQVVEHQDVIRALLLLNSEEFLLSSLGYNWLQGLELGEDEARLSGMKKQRQEPIKILKGLSWVMSLRGPTILALDQMDAIVSEQHILSGMTGKDEPTDEQKAAQAIIEGMGRGLSALADHTYRTLSLVTCLESTWEILRNSVLRSSTDRYEEPKILRPMPGPDTVKTLIAQRLAFAYESAGFKPAYPTWPFKPETLEAASGFTPREILKRCETHRQKFLEQGKVVELKDFTAIDTTARIQTDRDEFIKIDTMLEKLKRKAQPHALLAEDKEDELGGLLQAACRCLIRECPLPEEVDAILETKFGGGQSYPPIHARLRLVYVKQGAEETHICFRALQKIHHNSYLARLKAAMTFSGIDENIGFRRLFIVRRDPLPGGPQCLRITADFQKAGGRFADLSKEDLCTLWALQMIDRNPPPQFNEWLRDRRPVSKIPLMRAAAPELFRLRTAPGAPLGPSLDEEEEINLNAPVCADSDEQPGAPEEDEGLVLEATADIPIGVVIGESGSSEIFTLPVNDLSGHVMIMAGGDGDSSVLLQRIIENAALNGIPSFVVDAAGSLTGLGEPWPDPPDSWLEEDFELAEKYLKRSEVEVWTPGLVNGRPASLPGLPDFGAMEGKRDDGTGISREEILQLALGNVQQMLNEGWSSWSRKKTGVLSSALHYYADQGGAGLDDFLKLLENLPLEAGSKIRSAPKTARDMVQPIRARLKSDPLLNNKAHTPEAGKLFKRSKRRGKTPISVFNLAGLSNLEDRQRFMGLLTVDLLNRAAGLTSDAEKTTGLLVIDEARDFLPASKSPVCKTGLSLLAAHGRAAGLGLVLATSNPKSLDLNVISNWGTWFFGRANAPQSIKIIKKSMEERGGAKDIGRLAPGHFHVHPGGRFSTMPEVSVSMSLSFHLNEKLSESRLLRKVRLNNPEERISV